MGAHVELTGLDGHAREPKSLVELPGASLRIDDDTDAADLARLPAREYACVAEHGGADALVLDITVNREAGDAEHRQRVSREPLAQGRWELDRVDGGPCHGHVPDQPRTVSGNVRRPDPEAELVLPRIPLEEEIEREIAGAEVPAVIPLLEAPHHQLHGGYFFLRAKSAFIAGVGSPGFSIWSSNHSAVFRDTTNVGGTKASGGSSRNARR